MTYLYLQLARCNLGVALETEQLITKVKLTKHKVPLNAEDKTKVKIFLKKLGT